jgi:diguanylate cyclase (GGDEF)-like protein
MKREQAVRAPSDSPVMSPAEKGVILAVDDTADSLRLIVKTLEADGFCVHTAESGELALEAVANDPPELILLDIQMGGIDGFEVLRRLQANESTKEIPVIFVSASREVALIVRGLNMGAVDYIYKPFERQELLARTRNHVELYQLRTKLRSQAAELRATCESLEAEVKSRKQLETQLRSEQQQQEFFATHDLLTGLPNRRSFENALIRSISRAHRGTPSALLFMDVDHFKACNDTHGHAFGDSVLRAVAEEVAAEVRAEDIIARVGGDEFAALLEGADEQGARTVALRMRRRVQALQQSMDVDLDLSVGIAQVTDGCEFEQVLTAADHAMYAEKNARSLSSDSDADATR